VVRTAALAEQDMFVAGRGNEIPPKSSFFFHLKRKKKIKLHITFSNFQLEVHKFQLSTFKRRTCGRLGKRFLVLEDSVSA